MTAKRLGGGVHGEVRLWPQASTNADPARVRSKYIHWNLHDEHTTLTLGIPLIQLFFFAAANLCLWLHTTSLWDCFRSFSTLQVFWQPIVPWHIKNRHQVKPHICPLTAQWYIICLLWEITYHDRMVCMLSQRLVMVSSARWCHNSGMFRL